ncbi:hypothetical protein [Nocardia acidivorans]|uniref:hypothetical protein n=1 Tax=Nocardia acidivorans TaxID=404580 RepID=UPI000B03DA4F|nr:hypothetical protein [Nocardia acidivorans]
MRIKAWLASEGRLLRLGWAAGLGDLDAMYMIGRPFAVTRAARFWAAMPSIVLRSSSIAISFSNALPDS